jgi:penicillin-binding protein 1A
MKGNSSNRKYLIGFWTLFTLPFVTVVILFILISKGKLGPIPSFRELENPEYNLAAEVYSEDGVLLGKISFENRTWTEYKDLSPYLIDALIATEDIRYYRHSGIDIRGLGRAVVRTIVLGQKTGGGSTITQQWQNNYIQEILHAFLNYQKVEAWRFKIQGMADSCETSKRAIPRKR